MDIRALKNTAAQRLSTAREANKIVLIYGGIIIGLSALVTIVNYMTSLEISQSGGLRNLGLRSILSTLQNILPMLQSLILLALELGYVNAALRIGRGQYASPNSLKMGMDRFWPLLRCFLLQSAVFFGAGMLSFYLALQIYLLTPLSDAAVALLTPLVSGNTTLNPGTLLLDEALQLQLAEAMLPVFILFGILFVVISLPITYSFRMANYVLIDKPQAGGLMALRESKLMMHRNRFKLFKLDLSMWWYHLLSFLAPVVCYGDMILSLLGIEFPWSTEVSYFLFYGLYLVLELAIFFFLRNRVEVTYALAYETLRPEEKQEGGVVLGNIFQM